MGLARPRKPSETSKGYIKCGVYHIVGYSVIPRAVWMFSVDPMALRHPAETPDLFTFYSGFTAPKLSKYDHGAARGSVVPTGTPALV